jgi:xanthine permease XanP
MSHVEVHQTSENVAQTRHRLLYGLNDNPPFSDAIFVALQHVFAIFIPIVTPGLLICAALKLDIANTSYLLATGSICALVLNLIMPIDKTSAPTESNH